MYVYFRFSNKNNGNCLNKNYKFLKDFENNTSKS